MTRLAQWEWWRVQLRRPGWQGVIGGLFLARLAGDFGPTWIGGWLVLMLILVLGVGGYFAASRMTGRGWVLSPLWLGAAYLPWPRPDAEIATALGVAIAGALVLANLGSQQRVRLHRWLLPAVAVFALALYLNTLAPGLLPADSGEFQLVAAELGIAHPPGYPLYTLLGFLATRAPLADPAPMVNALSALFAALTLTLVLIAGGNLARSRAAGLIAVLALAGSTTFWAQATTANVRSFTALCTALILWSCLRISAEARLRDLALLALALGLGISHHLSLAILIIPVLLYLRNAGPAIACRPQARQEGRRWWGLASGRRWVTIAAAGFVPFLAWLYLPLRSTTGAALDPGNLRNPGGFLHHVLALGFEGDLFYFRTAAALVDRTLILGHILDLQFGWLLLFLAAAGWIGLVWRRRFPELVLLLLSCVSIAALAVTYRAPQTVEYLLPAYVALALSMAAGAGFLADLVRTYTTRAILLALLMVPGWLNVLALYPNFAELARQEPARQYAARLLHTAPPGSTLLANWHFATPLWYLQQVEEARPDVDVVYVAPGGEEYSATWQRLLARHAEEGPTLVTNYYTEFDELDIALRPWRGAWLAGAALDDWGDLPPRAVFDHRFLLQHVEIDRDLLDPGEVVAVTLHWEALEEPARDYTAFVHLTDPTGSVLGQGDVALPVDGWRQGRQITLHRLAVLPTVAPGGYRLRAGLYFTPSGGGWERVLTGEERDFAAVGEVDVGARRTPLATQHARRDSFVDGPTLVGVDYDRTLPERLRVYLHWRGSGHLRPLRAQLLSQGTVVAEASLPILASDRYAVTALDVPPDVQQLRLRVVDEAGEVLSVRRTWGWRRSGLTLPEASPDALYQPRGGKIALVGAEASREGENLRVDLRFLALTPVTDDYTVSVQVHGSTWRAQSDGTPALGAIPTLKWTQGMEVWDRHRLLWPREQDAPDAVLVAVYDAFTRLPLAVLDEELARRGYGELAPVPGGAGR